jgi:hypothetical protein
MKFLMPDSIQNPLAAAVFESIAAHLVSRADEIALFAQTRYSFEEWLNWEAFAACRARVGWTVAPKPCYSAHTDPGCKDYGDLLVTDKASNARVWIEIGLVHDGTGDKWIAKLDRDMEKLRQQFASSITPLQIIVLVSTSTIRAAANWER